MHELINIRVPMPTALVGHLQAFAANLAPNLASPRPGHFHSTLSIHERSEARAAVGAQGLGQPVSLVRDLDGNSWGTE